MVTTLDTLFDQIRTARPGYNPWVGFVVKDGTATYTLEPSDRPDLPFTHKLTGNHGDTYGYWTETSGKYVPVRRSGWYSSRGVLGTFDAPSTFSVKGWAVPSAL